jgi:hypothetical protein
MAVETRRHSAVIACQRATSTRHSGPFLRLPSAQGPTTKRRCPHAPRRSRQARTTSGAHPQGERLPQHVPSRPSNSGSSLISRRTMTSIAFPSPAPRLPYVPRVPGSGEDVWHRGVSWQSCLVVGIGDWPRTSHRAREWYSSLGIFPQASDIRFVKLYMLAISAISQQATSERPKLFRWSRSWGEHSRGSFVILTA